MFLRIFTLLVATLSVAATASESGSESFSIDDLKLEKLKKECSRLNSDSCFELGRLYDNGENTEKNPDNARQYFEKACEMDNSMGCTGLGLIYDYGKGVKRSISEAAKYYEKACSLGNPVGCYNLGNFYLGNHSHDEFFPINFPDAIRLFSAACDADDGNSCTNLGAVYMNGHGVKQEAAKAVQYSEKGCRLNNSNGCLNLGLIYEAGSLVKADASKAAEFIKKACELENGAACGKLGMQYYSEADYRQAEKYLEMGMKYGDPLSTLNLGKLYISSPAKQKSPEFSADLVRKSCDLGLGEGCYTYAGLLASSQSDSARIMEYYGKACRLNFEYGCLSLAGNYFSHTEIENNYAKALETYNQSCDRNFA
jgi:TPR repeat protein